MSYTSTQTSVAPSLQNIASIMLFVFNFNKHIKVCIKVFLRLDVMNVVIDKPNESS